MTAPSYWWIVGEGQVGYSRIWDGVSPDPAAASGGRLVLMKRVERKKPESGEREIVRGGERGEQSVERARRRKPETIARRRK